LIEIRPSTQAEIPAQKALWETCFGDASSFIDMFYENYCKPKDVLVLLEDGVLRSMAIILPMDIHFPDGTTGKAGYIYALSTDPSAQKKGYARELLNYVDFFLKKWGMDCAVLVPAEASLHRFFDIMGYRECFSNRKVEVASGMLPHPSESDTVTPVEPEEYGRIREHLLQERFHMAYDESLLSFQQASSRMFGGSLYRIDVDGTQGCAVAEFFGSDRVLVKELLVAPEHTARAAALLARALPASYYHLRTPSFWQGVPGSYVQAFGMVKWYDPGLEQLWFLEREGYLGLGFD